MMKKTVKKVMAFMLALMMVVSFVAVQPTQAASKKKSSKKQEYRFSPCNCSSFKMEGNKLTVKLSGSTFEKNNKATKTKKMTFKVADNCKWTYETFERSNGSNSTRNSTYKEVKKAIKGDRNSYKQQQKTGYIRLNAGMSTITVKNGKVVKVNYLFFF